MIASDNQHGQPAFSVRQVELSYVLVADADAGRTAACLESIKPFTVGALVARDGDEAAGILRRFGPPILLIIDLSLPRKDALALIEIVRRADRGRTGIIAWSASRELREFAAHRLAGLNVRVLGGAVAPAVLRGAIERVLRRGTTTHAPPPSSRVSTTLADDDVHETMTALAEQARQLCGTPGVAVYLKAAGETKFRASITWTSDEPIPHSPYYLPRVFGWILETGEALVSPDLATQPLSNVSLTTLQDVVRGLVAVPIVSGDQQIVGTICVFDVKPLTIGGVEVEALKALGRGVSLRPASAPIDPEAHPLPLFVPEPAATQPDDAIEPITLDAPTALLDRRSGSLAIARELARVRRERHHLSVVLFDVDALGAAGGRAVEESIRDPLAVVGDTLTKTIRGSDLAIRWSHEELLVVLPGLSEAEAHQVAERVRAGMQAGARHRFAVAGGVAELLAGDTLDTVVTKANEKVRLARERGHNRIG